MRLTLAILLLAATSCATELREGWYACGDDTGCPSEWFCRGGFCYSEPGPTDSGTDSLQDSGLDATTDSTPDSPDTGPPCVPATAEVDLLFVVDNSASMREEQRLLATAFGDLISGAVSETDLQVGVVTSDMGTAGYSGHTGACIPSEFGDDGVLRTMGNTSIPDCGASYPAFLSYEPGSNLTSYVASFSCVAQAGVFGCGWEQQLEAALKAITPPTSGITFVADSRGHAGPGAPNAGFLREDSVLVIVELTDEEDCSIRDVTIFEPSGSTSNLRCFENPEALHPAERYVNGFLAARRPERLVFAALVGIPTDLDGVPYSDMLTDPRLEERVDGAGALLEPSCATTDGVAYPPRRFIEVASGLETLGAATVVRSICETSLNGAVVSVRGAIESRLAGTCL